MRAALLLLAWTLSAQTVSTLVGDRHNPYGVIVGPDGAVYFCEIDSHQINRFDPKTKQVMTVVGTGLDQPYELRFDKAGNMYFVDMPKHVVLRMDKKTGSVTKVAGTGEAGFSGDGGAAAQAQLRQPHSLVFDRSGGLLIADIGNHRVRRVDLKTGTIDTLLGTGERKPTPDGPAKGAPLNGPRAIDFDAAGNMYIVLREGNSVYKVDRAGNIARIAGTGEKGYSGDGGSALTAKLNGPKGISVLGNDVYLADTENHVIRKVDLRTGTISTVVGDGQKGDGPDGDPAHCRLNRPHGIFVDKAGRVYIGDSENHRIRVLTPGKSR